MMRSRAARYTALILCSLAVGAALANNTPPPATTSPPQAVSTSTSGAAAVSGARSDATGGNASAISGPSTSSAAGGTSTSTSTSGDSKAIQGQGQTLSDQSQTDSRMYVLPGPVWTPPMARVECPTPTIANRSYSLGWGAVSMARGDTSTDDCVLITMMNAYIDACQYDRAQQVRDGLVAKRLPDFKPKAVEFVDLMKKECDALKAPPPAPPVEVRYVTVTPPAATPAPPEAVKPLAVERKKLRQVCPAPKK